MTYLQTFEAELLKRLNSGADDASIVRFAGEKILESYRNGLAAGGKAEKIIRNGKSRRRGFHPETKTDEAK